MQLAATPELTLAVHNDLASGDQTLGVCAARGDARQLEQLAKADRVAGDLNRDLDPGSVPEHPPDLRSRAVGLATAGADGAVADPHDHVSRPGRQRERQEIAHGTTVPAVRTNQLVDNGHRLGPNRNRRVAPATRQRSGSEPARSNGPALLLVDQLAAAGGRRVALPEPTVA
jgi:hypothetical protein